MDPPAPSVERVSEWYNFKDFGEFLDRYFTVCGLMRTPQDFGTVALSYLRRAQELGTVHVEFHISSSYHIIESRLDWGDILAAVIASCETAESSSTDVSCLLIPDLSPHFGVEKCSDVLDVVLANPHPRVVALGMGGPMHHWFEEDYGSLMNRAREAGLHLVSHAGEHGGPEEVRHAVEVFGAERIQHGISAIQDPAVVELLVQRDIPCDVCPASNIALGAVPNIGAHPLPEMIRAGIPVTLGSDDPPMFQTDLLNEYRLAWEGCRIGATTLAQFARNSIERSFAPEERKGEWLRRWEEWANA